MQKKYILLSLNPGYDRWLQIDDGASFERVYRASSVRIVPSGKGINVARCFERMGFHNYTGLCITGGEAGKLLQQSIQREGMKLEALHIRNETRVNVTAFLAAKQDTITFNEPGPWIYPEELDAFFQKYARMLEENPNASVVVSGSAPAGFDTAHYKRMLNMARNGAHPLVIDIGGQWLNDSTGGPIHTLKVNREEFRHAFGIDAKDSPGEVRAFIRQHHIETAIITDGADGSRAFDLHRGDWYASFEASASGVHAVGSGDSYMAGYLMACAGGADLPQALKEATAFGMANAQVVEPAMITPEQVERAKGFIAVVPGR